MVVDSTLLEFVRRVINEEPRQGLLLEVRKRWASDPQIKAKGVKALGLYLYYMAWARALNTQDVVEAGPFYEQVVDAGVREQDEELTVLLLGLVFQMGTEAMPLARQVALFLRDPSDSIAERAVDALARMGPNAYHAVRPVVREGSPLEKRRLEHVKPFWGIAVIPS